MSPILSGIKDSPKTMDPMINPRIKTIPIEIIGFGTFFKNPSSKYLLNLGFEIKRFIAMNIGMTSAISVTVEVSKFPQVYLVEKIDMISHDGRSQIRVIYTSSFLHFPKIKEIKRDMLIVREIYVQPPQTRAIAAIVNPADNPKINLFFSFPALHAEMKKYKEMNKKKNPADSFSGMPAIVLGRSAGRIVKNKEEINATIFAFNSPR